jgi:hypothetical protein
MLLSSEIVSKREGMIYPSADLPSHDIHPPPAYADIMLHQILQVLHFQFSPRFSLTSATPLMNRIVRHSHDKTYASYHKKVLALVNPFHCDEVLIQSSILRQHCLWFQHTHLANFSLVNNLYLLHKVPAFENSYLSSDKI